MSDSQAARTLRAAVFAALVVLLAALGQVLLTGRPLPVTVLAVAAVAVFALALALAGSARSLRRIAALLLPLQLALSVLFDLAQATCSPAGAASALHGFEPLVCRAGSIGGFLLGHQGHTPPAVPAPLGGLLLLLAHLAVGLLAAYWLRTADAALRGLGEAMRTLREFLHSFLPAAGRLLLLAAPALARAPARVPIPRASRQRIPAQDVLLGPAVRRGPPVLVPAA
ncbi:hypothetical protein [Kitasatospora sp. NPDC050543]|uniref:hypothetical protein n=1 Tax=Kitasatospora sp. NPDC050543 TaxID=3364054 RepID=UPI0037ACD596